MWVSRYDSWGQAGGLSHGRLLNVLKMDSGLSKTPQLCCAFSHRKELSLLARLWRQNDVSKLWSHMVHHVKVTHFTAKRAWWAPGKCESVFCGQELHFNSELHIRTNALLSSKFLLTPDLHYSTLSHPILNLLESILGHLELTIKWLSFYTSLSEASCLNVAFVERFEFDSQKFLVKSVVASAS